SPSPRPPIGTPPDLMFEMTFISGCSGRNGLPYGLGPGGSSSPKKRLKARSCGSESRCSRQRMTRGSSHAWRIWAKTSGASGCARSTPLISAPSAPPIFRTCRAAMVLGELDDHGLVVRRPIRAVDPDRAQPRCQILSNEDVVAAIGRLALLALMYAEGVR